MTWIWKRSDFSQEITTDSVHYKKSFFARRVDVNFMRQLAWPPETDDERKSSGNEAVKTSLTLWLVQAHLEMF